jgi:putative acetyltransferase
MITIVRTNSDNPDFVELVRILDVELAQRDGEDHSFYTQFNTIQKIKHVVLAYQGTSPLGCGAIKEINDGIIEVKRMFVSPKFRRTGVAQKILSELENWATEMSITKCVLETGRRQPEAIRLYTKSGYKIIPNYGQYAGIVNSVCFEKELKSNKS